MGGLRSIWWQISVHAAVAAGTAVILALTFAPAAGLAATPVVATIAWSRVELIDHTLPQVIAGTVMGALVAAVVFTLAR